MLIRRREILKTSQSADGKYVYYESSTLYRSADYGNNFTAVTGIGWYPHTTHPTIRVSRDGKYVLVSDAYGVRFSTNYGVNFSTLKSGEVRATVDMSDDGMYIAIPVNGTLTIDIYSNYGSSFTNYSIGSPYYGSIIGIDRVLVPRNGAGKIVALYYDSNADQSEGEFGIRTALINSPSSWTYKLGYLINSSIIDISTKIALDADMSYNGVYSGIIVFFFSSRYVFVTSNSWQNVAFQEEVETYYIRYSADGSIVVKLGLITDFLLISNNYGGDYTAKNFPNGSQSFIGLQVNSDASLIKAFTTNGIYTSYNQGAWEFIGKTIGQGAAIECNIL